MTASVREYASERPNTDYAALASRFGDPQKIAESCVAEMEPEELLAEMQIRQKILFLAICVITVLMMVRIIYLTSAYANVRNSINGYAIVEVIEVERETYIEGEFE